MLIPVLVSIAIVAVIVSIFLVIFSGDKSVPKSREKLNSTVQKKGKSAVIKEYEKRLAHDPHNVGALESLGEVYYSDGNWEKVWSIYRTLYDLSTAHIEINVAKTTSRLGVAAFNLGKIDEAINYLLVSTKKDSEVFDTAFYLGRAFEEKGNLEKAIICYKKSKLLSPENIRVCQALGTCLFKGQKYKECLPFLKRVLEEQPDNKEVLYQMAVSMSESGYTDRALKVFVHLRTDPTFGAQCCLEAGRIHEYQKNFSAAVQDYEIGMKLENVPEKISVQILYRCALAYIGLNNIPKALMLLRQIQNMHGHYKDVDTLVARYKEINQNQNLQVYLMSGTSDFVALCRKFIANFYKDSFVKIEDVAIASECVEIICFANNAKWESRVIFRFYRTQTIIGDIYIREFHSKVRDAKCDSGYCVTMGTFSDSAHKYIEGRPIDLIEKDQLVKALKQINMYN